MSATIRDVARAAGVSVATVSRALTGSGPVSDDARRRVGDAAAALHYAPNASARSLVSSRTSTIGFLLPGLYGEFLSEVIRGADLAARAAGYHLLVSSALDGREEVEHALHAMRGRVDGLLVMAPDAASATFAAELPRSCPVVLLNGPSDAADVDVVAVDSYGGARAMTDHLLALGHRRIAYVAGPAHNHDSAERRRGWRAALRDAGVLPDPSWELPGDFGEASGYDAARRVLAGDGARSATRPTALFAANDAMAVGAISALREAGLAVPGDVAVVGFDDIPMARYVDPPLTSVHVPIPELGSRAVARLVEALGGGEHAPRRELLHATLVVRASCGAAVRAPP